MLTDGLLASRFLMPADGLARTQERALNTPAQQANISAPAGSVAPADNTTAATNTPAAAAASANRGSSLIDQQPNSDATLPNSISALVAQAAAQAAADADIASGLTQEELQVVRELQSRDLEVRIEEAQHFRTAGGLASGTIDLQYQQGPDGLFYAVGGGVNVQTTPTTDPARAAADAATFARAATAPATAGAQDFSVARSATADAASQLRQAFANVVDPTAEPTALPEADENDDPFAPVDLAV